MMYTKISEPILYVYDINTNEPLGEVTFHLSTEAERDLLKLVNENKEPESFLATDVIFTPTKGFMSDIDAKPVRRRGVLRTLYYDDVSGTYDQILVQMIYDARAYGYVMGRPYIFESVNHSNIKVESIRY
ncbi:MAG: hypothetical protein H6Q60_786 [Oscillospiraceae bacterium]|nr:hypothetical protein [Oscillospiraceae bacterium]